MTLMGYFFKFPTKALLYSHTQMYVGPFFLHIGPTPTPPAGGGFNVIFIGKTPTQPMMCFHIYAKTGSLPRLFLYPQYVLSCLAQGKHSANV
jgi:hypothetical protein